MYPGPVVVQEWTIRFRLSIDLEYEQAKEAIQSDGSLHHGVTKFECDHSDVAGRNGIRQLTQHRSILLSMPTVRHTIGGSNACCFQSRVKEEKDALQTFHSAENGVEWYEWTSNDT
ncbi:hypothetical protein TNCV_2939451 [Trichonephila clavipes]|nr:hypothetical protein TNCV_2939451 [Trichonephila clavipes]